MIKAILLVFDPANTWDDIVQDRRGLVFMLFLFLVPLLALTCSVEGYGMATWGKYFAPPGKWFGSPSVHQDFSVVRVVVYELLQFITSVLVVLVGAKLVKALGETFHGRHTYTQTFRAVVYGLSPVFVLRLLDAFPSMNAWATYTIGILLSIAVMYQGIPRVMEPDPPHAFGLYITSGLLLAMAGGLGRFLTWWWAKGEFTKVQGVVDHFMTNVFSRLHL